MVSATRIFTSTQRFVLTVILLAFVACSALAARYHDPRDPPASSDDLQVQTSDYLLWHRLESDSSGPDSLTESLRLFSTIADKLASDAIGTFESTTGTARPTSFQSIKQPAAEQ